ncbi:hypothetical protein ACLOJK_039903 [Asimina triloba]
MILAMIELPCGPIEAPPSRLLDHGSPLPVMSPDSSIINPQRRSDLPRCYLSQVQVGSVEGRVGVQHLDEMPNKVSIDAIKEANDLSGDTIYVGKKVIIP